MATYVWPGGLPQNVTTSYGEEGGLLILRSPMDKGPAKQRRTGNMPKPMTVTFQMSESELVIFETFVYTTIRGTSRFEFPHPRLNTTVKVRIVPEGEGKLFSISYLTPIIWVVSFKLEVLP